MSEPDGAEEFEDFEVPCEGVVSIDAAAMASATAVDEANLSSVAVEGDAPDFGMGAKRTVSALMLPPQRQDSANSIHSIMEVVRERVGKLQGTLAGGLLTGGSEGDDWNPRSYRGSPRTNRAVVSQEAADFCMISPRRAMFPWSDTPRRTLRSVGTTPASRLQKKETGAVTSRKEEEVSESSAYCPMPRCSVPFRLAMLCPTVIMLCACIGVFVPLALFSLEAQQAVFASYTHSVQTQKELISSIVLNATQWVLLEASKSVEKAVFVGIVEPPDRAVDTLSGAIRMARIRGGCNFSEAEQRHAIAQRALEELNNQWTCHQLNNNLCSGRSLSLYAAMDTGEVSGAAFRPRFWGTSLAQEAPFLADAPAGSPTNLSVFEASGLIGDRGAVYLTRPYLSAVEPFYEVQAKLANESLRSDAPINSFPLGVQGLLKKTWSRVFLFHPWWSEESSSGHLALSWTAPLAQCGNYSCMDGVVGADTTLDLVSYELRLAWLRLQWDLRGPPWGYELASENSSIFIVKQVSPLYPSQEGLLVGASHFTEALIPGRLLHAVNSPSSIVAITAQAVLQRYGAWNSTELTRRDKDRSFHFSLRDAREGRWRECHPLAQTDATAEDPDHDWESNCYQATTHTIYLDDTLQWLVVVSTPAAAFSKFHVDKAIQVELEVKREHHEAEGKQWDTLIESAFLGVLASAVVVIMGLVTSCWVLRPLRGLSKLMIRLTQLDFAHDSEEYRKLQDGEPSHIWEVDSLKDGFWRLSRSIEVFARFVPDSVVRRLITGDDKASRLHVLRKNVSIMFSDVRDFTSISEELKQDDLIMLLTVYLTGMTRVIESYQGVVGEILGDGILAFWNTPDDVAQHAAKACSAALAQQQALIQLNEEFKKMGLPSLSIRIGIHTGEVLTGNIGCLSGKMKFGCMGDPVNLASRLEGLCKTYGVGILCSEVTKSQLPKEDGFVCRKLDLVQVKGKKEPTIIYEVIGRQPPRKAGASKPTSPVNLIPASPSFLDRSPRRSRGDRRLEPRSASADLLAFQPVPPTRIEQAQLYEQALQAYTQQQFSEATQLAAQLLEDRPEDVAAQRLLKRSHSLAVKAAGGPEDAEHQELAAWSAVVSITEK